MSTNIPALEDLPSLAGRRVLLRADFNVPLADGRITDDLRIRAALPTIQWLQGQGAEVVACTHLGRPKGKPDPRYSVAPAVGEYVRPMSSSRTPNDASLKKSRMRSSVSPGVA